LEGQNSLHEMNEGASYLINHQSNEPYLMKRRAYFFWERSVQ